VGKIGGAQGVPHISRFLRDVGGMSIVSYAPRLKPFLNLSEAQTFAEK
jgi:hypothetical protein